MRFDGHSWHVEPVSESEFQRLTESVTESQPGVEKILEAMSKPRYEWPCPFCSERRLCDLLGEVEVDELGVPELWNASISTLKEMRKTAFLLSDLLGGLMEWLTKRVLPSDDRGARVYKCPVHDIFYIPYRGPLADPWHVFVSYNDEVHLRPGRFIYCLGMNETISRSGQTTNVQFCGRLLEWKGKSEAVGIGEGGYTCHIHGDLTFLVTGGDPAGPYLVGRRFVD